MAKKWKIKYLIKPDWAIGENNGIIKWVEIGSGGTLGATALIHFLGCLKHFLQ